MLSTLSTQILLIYGSQRQTQRVENFNVYVDEIAIEESSPIFMHWKNCGSPYNTYEQLPNLVLDSIEITLYPPSISHNMTDVDIEDEYTNAKKLVVRAANREAILKIGKAQVNEDQQQQPQLGADFSHLELLPDHMKRPCWVCPDGAIYLEAFHELYNQAYDFLVAIAEPVARPEFIHEYKLTPYSLYAAVATNIDTESIIRVLTALSKNSLPSSVTTFIRECTKRYGKAKLILKHNKMYVESEHPAVLRELLRDPLIAQARVMDQHSTSNNNKDMNADGFLESAKALEMDENLRILNVDPNVDDASEDDEDEDEDNEIYEYLFDKSQDNNNSNKNEENNQQKKKQKKEIPSSKKPATVCAFQIKDESVEIVKQQAIEADYPLMEEYDFRYVP